MSRTSNIYQYMEKPSCECNYKPYVTIRLEKLLDQRGSYSETNEVLTLAFLKVKVPWGIILCCWVSSSQRF